MTCLIPNTLPVSSNKNFSWHHNHVVVQDYLWVTIIYNFFDFAVTISLWRVINIPCEVGGISHINGTRNKLVIKILETISDP